MVRTDRLQRQPELSPQGKYLKAREQFANALHTPRGQFDGNALFDAYSNVWRTMTVLPGRSTEFIATTLRELAVQGASEAKRRGNTNTTALMEKQIQIIDDRLAVRQGKYELVEVRTDHGDQHGAPDVRIPYYRRPDGTTYRGEPEDIELSGVTGAILSPEASLRADSYPGLSAELYRELRRRVEPKL
jgi:hypothetical protein